MLCEWGCAGRTASQGVLVHICLGGKRSYCVMHIRSLTLILVSLATDGINMHLLDISLTKDAL